MINSPVQDVTHAVTFNLDFSTGTSVDSVISVATASISASVPAANVTYIIEPADDTDDAMDTLPFDVTRDGPLDTTVHLETGRPRAVSSGVAACEERETYAMLMLRNMVTFSAVDQRPTHTLQTH